MKVLHLSTTDIKGGASRGSYSLHKALVRSGVDSLILVADKSSDDFTVINAYTKSQKFFNQVKSKIEQINVNNYLNKASNSSLFSAPWIPRDMENQITKINPDIIHLHWVCGGFLSPETLQKFRNIPIVWTLRDMWAFTGGCHYSQACDRFQNSCGNCPILGSEVDNDLSKKIWTQKQRAWESLNITIVGISHWLTDCARTSSLFRNKRIELIHNALDERIYKPISQKIAREILNIDQDKNIILFGALNALKDERKGFMYLVQALKKLSEQGLGETAELIIFGASAPKDSPQLGMKTHYLGVLQDDVTLALTYCAADVMVTPSLEEAFGKTAMESLACGVPVVCFDTTGLKDIVDHKINGYLAECFSAHDLAQGIAWVLEDKVRWRSLSQRSREKVEAEFTLKIQADNYLSLYHRLIGEK